MHVVGAWTNGIVGVQNWQTVADKIQKAWNIHAPPDYRFALLYTTPCPPTDLFRKPTNSSSYSSAGTIEELEEGERSSKTILIDSEDEWSLIWHFYPPLKAMKTYPSNSSEFVRPHLTRKSFEIILVPTLQAEPRAPATTAIKAPTLPLKTPTASASSVNPPLKTTTLASGPRSQSTVIPTAKSTDTAAGSTPSSTAEMKPTAKPSTTAPISSTPASFALADDPATTVPRAVPQASSGSQSSAGAQTTPQSNPLAALLNSVTNDGGSALPSAALNGIFTLLNVATASPMVQSAVSTGMDSITRAIREANTNAEQRMHNRRSSHTRPSGNAATDTAADVGNVAGTAGGAAATAATSLWDAYRREIKGARESTAPAASASNAGGNAGAVPSNSTSTEVPASQASAPTSSTLPAAASTIPATSSQPKKAEQKSAATASKGVNVMNDYLADAWTRRLAQIQGDQVVNRNAFERAKTASVPVDASTNNAAAGPAPGTSSSIDNGASASQAQDKGKGKEKETSPPITSAKVEAQNEELQTAFEAMLARMRGGSHGAGPAPAAPKADLDPMKPTAAGIPSYGLRAPPSAPSDATATHATTIADSTTSESGEWLELAAGSGSDSDSNPN